MGFFHCEDRMTHRDASFRLEGITRRYGELTALEDIDFVVEQSGYVSLLGPAHHLRLRKA
jgi:ABC-type sugar transport system ATPase subunit